MFRAASRRASASSTPALRLSQAQRQPLSRLIHNDARPSLLLRSSNAPSLVRSQLPHVRHLSYTQRIRRIYREASKGIFRKNPILLPLALVSFVAAFTAFGYASYVEATRVAPQYHKFPGPVADTLRTAVYYTEIDLNPFKALDAYKEALRTGLELGMHPFSDEILGIKLQVAMMLEKAGLVKQAIEAAGAGAGKPAPSPAQAKVEADQVQVSDEALREAEKDLVAMQEFEARQRDRALKKVVGMEMKLAELYASDHIQDEKKAEAAQVAAVELSLKELHRRLQLGLPVGVADSDDAAGEPWLNMVEIATALAELAATYTAKERYELAMPLYMRALDLIRQSEGNSVSCKQVVLLNDVATAMTGQVQKPTPGQKQGSQDQIIEAARQWAQKSIDVAARIQPPLRDEECDITCVVATYNLGEIAELQKKPDVARSRYTEALSLAKGLDYEDGVAMANAALKRLSKK
ncbi:hypothetical protein N7468_010130 [Penicillium chermesinum]|uniref:TPR domain protein n=1 Tax=Penicillium chermesinum TaxID=63820 RepID=A0A9W9NC37_9EURO|nr:uncharacterized protein N7468_010130 [Penicillium chermesinum]KAJ5217122.1 hypothetical protein N7468_010130 [Penicillium chermesinum]